MEEVLRTGQMMWFSQIRLKKGPRLMAATGCAGRQLPRSRSKTTVGNIASATALFQSSNVHEMCGCFASTKVTAWIAQSMRPVISSASVSPAPPHGSQLRSSSSRLLSPTHKSAGHHGPP